MGRLIDTLLAFSRLGRAEVSMTLLDMKTLIENAWEEAQIAHQGRNVALTLGNVPPAYGGGRRNQQGRELLFYPERTGLKTAAARSGRDCGGPAMPRTPGMPE